MPGAESPGKQANVARLQIQAATAQRNKRARRTEFAPWLEAPGGPRRSPLPSATTPQTNKTRNRPSRSP